MQERYITEIQFKSLPIRKLLHPDEFRHDKIHDEAYEKRHHLRRNRQQYIVANPICGASADICNFKGTTQQLLNMVWVQDELICSE